MVSEKEDVENMTEAYHRGYRKGWEEGYKIGEEEGFKEGMHNPEKWER